ncbi:hypothetical protein EMIT0P2_20603 [Pseudomonas sp. IT-P2]
MKQLTPLWLHCCVKQWPNRTEFCLIMKKGDFGRPFLCLRFGEVSLSGYSGETIPFAWRSVSLIGSIVYSRLGLV